MPFPATRKDLIPAGYKFEDDSTCRSADCNASIEWWITPRGKRMPIDYMPNDNSPVVPHWSTCVDADHFRR